MPASLVSYRPLAKISPPTEEEGSRLGIGFELRIVLVLEERNELLRDVASSFASARRTRGFVYDLSRHGCLSARPTFSSHLAAFFSRSRTDRIKVRVSGAQRLGRLCLGNSFLAAAPVAVAPAPAMRCTEDMKGCRPA